MIDTDNLRTASLYINNQLLSRGLLRDGQSIDFASPAMFDDEAAATMGRIVSVLNDLILRRDRDAEHRESLSATMRTLRADNLKHTNDIARLAEKHTEAKRKLDIAEASETSLKSQMKSADAAIRGLKEEVARTKGLVAQARAACATDVRRRDRQIDTLKKQLGEAGRARGARGNPAVTSIIVTGDVGEQKSSPARGGSTQSDDYDLRNETNCFLAKLAQNLSEENEAILTIMRRTMKQLRNMSGWSNENEDGLVVKQEGWEDMAAELDSVLDHMRTILTNPSFVPIEEVMVREEEISRLKDGWVKMESRWTEAVHLIDGWRKRMAANGRPICEEELQMGLRLSPVRVRDVAETRQAVGLRLSAVAEEPEDDGDVMNSPCPSAHRSPHMQTIDEYDQDDHESDPESDFDDHVPVEEYDVEEPNVQILQQSTGVPFMQHGPDSSPLPEPPQMTPLRDSASAGNRGSARINRHPKKHGDYTTIVEEDTWEMAGLADPLPIRANRDPLDRVSSASSLEEVLLVNPRRSDRASTPHRDSPRRSVDRPDSRSGTAPPSPNRSPRRTASRLPLPRNIDPAPQQSPLTMATIAAKLAASEREADAARVRAKLRAARGTRGVKKPTITRSQPEPEQTTQEQSSPRNGLEDVDPVKRDPTPPADEHQLKPEKRRRERRTSKTASRRRSTLSPWELESLITGKVQ
ncbi:uncharacterized protein NECHADRAFT_41370 [Fusarium vanettenii 77-13-4]|uniref:NIMA interactive protein n=1 Tax=Fusarium vanettenii (strain ATCC MYA-4622 / CBS 123669 / FGSC 9596 / NRRL 45880 / 77-13-4) TaxID=660122 RepID=C7YR78_FUSV7|nr:uncharacterized protein NECHADRAFT_41370 [Fusarium vanettenii 77-13-4]EEU45033.1 hypothetical protein NECHADRAFT_41370 [Fusarium vanettenii 77-13-4]